MNTTMDTLTVYFLEEKCAIEKCFKHIHTKSDGIKDAQWVGDGIPPTLINTIPDFNAFFDLVGSRITPDLDFDKPHLAYNFHFRAPHSVSFFACFDTFGGMPLYKAHTDAVNRALNYLLSNALKPVLQKEDDAYFIVGAMLHSDSEHGIPLISSKVIILNYCKNSQDERKRLSFGALMDAYRKTMELYASSLRSGIESLGQKTRSVPHTNRFELDIINDEKLDDIYHNLFSTEGMVLFDVTPIEQTD